MHRTVSICSALALLAACQPKEPEEVSVDLAEQVTIDALMTHLETLEAIGAEHGDTRVSLTEGYADSVEYAQGVLENAGYEVTLHEYRFARYAVSSASASVGGSALDWQGEGDDGFHVFTYSTGGQVSGELVPVDVMIPPGAEDSSTSGCEASDFEGFPAGSVALIQRGSCTFATKVGHAADAGASAAVIFNEGQEDRDGPVAGVLDESGSTIPALGVSYARGEAWATAASRPTIDLAVEAGTIEDVEHNVIAETPGGDPDRVVMVGAHLDSVAAGPGINDNGSGTALVLETAVQIAERGYEPPNKIRFALWGAEEQGLVGSWHWLHDEETEEVDRGDDLLAYLNYDMIASGNGYRLLYDGEARQGGSEASGAIEAITAEWFHGREMAYAETPLLIPSDSYWFVAAGIPTGGLFSGAFSPKEQAWVEHVGGEADRALDPCYHRACDLVENTDPVLYEELSSAAAYTIQELAERTTPLAEEPPAERRALTDLPRPWGCHDHVRWDR